MWGGSRGAWGTPPRRIRSRWSATSWRCCPRKRWTDACHRLIFHGRRCCTARRPACEACPVAQLCPRLGV
ncbi:hypothetical protein [Bowdeniella massiliensis]|uniref:hypothetical protein n=1 Tax=Bowdeniella massiliensis TaxID=2932264 RepID=UPI0032B27A0E